MYQQDNLTPPPVYPEQQQPVQYQVSFGEAVSRGFSNYCNFDGRASRSEFWWWYLFQTIVSIPFGVGFAVCHAMDSKAAILFQILNWIISLALFLPTLGVFVRRMHDIGKSGWWYFLNFICLIGSIILLIWELKESDPYENEYGPVPNTEPAQ